MKTNSIGPTTISVIAAILIASALFFYKQYSAQVPATPIQTPAVVNINQDPVMAPPPLTAEVNTEVLELPKPVAPPKNINTALLELFGEKALLSMLSINDFIDHFVVTVDNLGGPAATSDKWPVKKPTGQFQTEMQGKQAVISPSNATRYQPYVTLLNKLDLKKAAELYFGLYPKFQAAYVNIGYPDQQFNQRFIQVLDLLIKTPQASDLIPVEMMKVEGPYQFAQPWAHFQFQKSSYEQLPIGQKIMLRLGPKNEAIVKVKLKEFRALINRPLPE
jgi:hypothetical protein